MCVFVGPYINSGKEELMATRNKRRPYLNPDDKLIEIRDAIALLGAVPYSIRSGKQHRRLTSLKVYEWRLERRISTGAWG